MKLSQKIVLLLAGSLLTSSCGLIGLKRNVKQIEAHGVIAVQVSMPPSSATTYALALTGPDGTNDMVGFQPVGTDGTAVFLLRQKRDYNIGAFTDVNGNQRYDGGEPAGVLRKVRPVPLSDSQSRTRALPLDLSPTNGLPPGQSFVLPAENADLGEALTVALGEVVKLDDPRFTVENGDMGLWKPYEFLQRYGMGIFFLEPYQADKIPVLFVYGISGSFQDWKPMLEALDRKKFQPWLFYYPGGINLDKSANALATGMAVLQKRHGFPRLCIVAHSMGGLVARGAIQRTAGVMEKDGNFITEFISIATPWGGHEAAAKGVKHLRYPAPAWHDMSPGSPYLKGLVSQPWPAGTRHDVIFTYKGSGGIGLPDDNDGVVGVESQLTISMQERAASIFGLHLDHNSVLNSPILWKHVQECLARDVAESTKK